jgi:hypothetical protein
MVRSAAIIAALLLGGCPDATPGSGPDGGAHTVGDAGPEARDVGGSRDRDLTPDAGSVAADAGCATQAVCAEAERCRAGRCEPVEDEAPCDDDEDCGKLRACSVLGLCYAGDCLTHGDCPADRRCFDDRCTPRLTPQDGIFFERRSPAVLDQHHGTIPFPGQIGYGWGGGLFDFDADGDLDIFLGTRYRFHEHESPPCLYRNESLPAQLRFAPVPGFCEHLEGVEISSAYGIDLEGDGYHELVMLGPRIAWLQRFHPVVERTDLLALSADPDHALCNAGALIQDDLDLDGRIDLIIGCQEFYGEEASIAHPNLALRQTAAGGFEVIGRDPDLAAGAISVFDDDGSTLALARLDVDRDGLPDLLVANDTFSTLGVPGVTEPSFTTERTTGAYYRRCSPLEDCRYSRRHFAAGDPAWGSFMGFGAVDVEGVGELLYITDQGPNRMVDLSVDPGLDHAADLDVELSHSGGVILFSWGVVVDDFDRDGREDFYVSQGNVIMRGNDAEFARHHDVLFLQHRPGAFIGLSDEVGIPPNTMADARSQLRVYAARAAVRADLDGDGFLEIIESSLQGYLRVIAEVPTLGATPRCQIVPHPRVVPGFGSGFGLAEGDSERFVRRDVQGQMRFGASPFLLSSAGRGRVRFPSGAILPFDCRDGAGPVHLDEGDWMSLSRAAEVTVNQSHHPDGTAVTLAFRTADGQVVLSPDGVLTDGRFAAQPPEEARAVMVRLDGRWVARWWPLPAAP